MITLTDFTVSDKLLQEINKNIVDQFDKNKKVLNSPTGQFFYDPWLINDEYKGTCWEELLKTLPDNIGEARIIKLDPGTCYFSHCDIDDRYHLCIDNFKSFLHCFENKISYTIEKNGHWYDMNAGLLHTAVNADSRPRYQIVVRHLLKRNVLKLPVKCEFKFSNCYEARYLIDQKISQMLNNDNKKGLINNFNFNGTTYSVEIEKSRLKDYELLVTPEIGELII
jgi:hypothetical protein